MYLKHFSIQSKIEKSFEIMYLDKVQNWGSCSSWARVTGFEGSSMFTCNPVNSTTSSSH